SDRCDGGCPVLEAVSDAPVCAGQPIHLQASAIPGAAYHWIGPNGFASSERSPTIAGAAAENAGEYRVSVTLGLATTPPVSTSVVVRPRGDANGDGRLDVGDVFFLIDSLFSGGPAPNACGADANGDGRLDVEDVFLLVNHLFSGGPAPL